MNNLESFEQSVEESRDKAALLDDYPLTQTQIGIFVECQTHPGTTIYNIPYLFKISDKVDTERLKTAVEKTIDAHPYVKITLFQDDMGEVRAKRNDSDKPVVEIISCEHIPANQEMVQPYELLGDRLYRTRIYQTGDGNYLFMDFHHIICDGASEKIIIRDMNRAYEGEMLETESYTGFEIALDEEKLRKTDAYEKAKNYYDSIFEGIDSNFLPPKDGNASVDVPGEINYVSGISVEEVKAYCQKNDITLNAFFNGVFAVVLSKYNYRDEAVYTTIYHGRKDARMKDSVSMLVKTLPVYCKIDGSLKIVDMLKTIKDHIFDSRANDLYSFGEISRAYNLPADIMFAYQGEGFVFDTIAGEKAEPCSVSLDTVKSPIAVELMIRQGKIILTAEYRNDMYAKETISGMLDCMDKVTEEFLCKTYIKDVSMLCDKAREQMERFNDTDFPVTEVPVHRLFERQAELHAPETAVIAAGEKLTYKELNDRANRLAQALVQSGLTIGESVGIILPRIVDVPVAEYGIFKAGGAFLTMLPDYPDDRISYCLEDAGSRFVVTTKEIKEQKKELFSKGNYTVVTVEDFAEGADTENLKLEVPVDSLAYIIYTSGSTGRPKGVMIEHRNLCNFVNDNPKNHETAHLVHYGKTALAVASISFDFSLMEMHVPLCNGRSVCIATEEEIYSPLSLLKLIEENHVDAILGTPSFISNFVDMVQDSEVLRQIRLYDVGAEAFPEKLYEKLHTLSPEAIIINGYGPTETTIGGIAKVMDGTGNVTIGTPAGNYKAYICDKCGKILPAGARGEMVICGAGVGRGYVNLPEKTKEVFITLNGRKAYRSGDLARYNQEGEIEFFGRLDNQVKLRGLRVELDEISNVMSTYPSVTNAIVLVKGEGQQQFLCGYYVAEKEIDHADLIEHMKKSLAPYMIPSVLIPLDVIPLTSNGKINKKALPEPERKAEEIVAPQNEIQQKIFDCIAEVIGNREFGITTDIYEAGLTSMGAIRLNVLLARAFDVVVRNQDLKENDTIEKLEKFVAGAGKAEAYEVYPDYPLTQTQNGIFVECVANAGTTIYNIPSLFRLGDGVDVEKLKAAVEKTIDAHPYVKTKLFFNGEGEVRAARNDNEDPKVDIISCARIPGNEELVRPFKLMDSSLYRAKIYQTNDGNYLFLDFHHIICDGVSEDIIIGDINRAYDGETLQTENYTGFEVALDEEKLRKTEAYDKAKKYYDSIFEGVDANFLPPKDGNASVEVPGEARFVSGFPVEEIKAYCKKNDITLNAFFNGVLAVVLSKYNYRDEAVFTTIYNGRNDARLEDSVTMLVKTLPVYCKTEGSLKITDMLKAVKNQLFDSMANDLYSFGEISRAYNLPSDILFAYQGEDSESEIIAGENAEICEIRLDTAKAPLSIDVMIREGKITFAAEYRNDMYARETVLGMLACMNHVMEEFLSKTYIRDISMMCDAAREQMEHFNDTDCPVTEVPVHRLFERQVSLHAHETAVIADGKKLTYQELNNRANRLAQLLMQAGLTVGEAVGIILPRIVDVPVAEYGILKAGGAFLPMLPDYPDDRISYCLEDSGSRFVVTTKEIKEEKKELLSKGNYTILTVEELADAEDTENSTLEVPVDSLAYIIYTSGSTGTPKGVMIEHRNLCNFVDANPKNHETVNFVSYGKTALSVAAISFDFSLMEIHIPLCNGMAVCMANEEEIYNPLSLLRLIRENHVDVISGTPSFISNFVDIPLAEEVLRQVKMYDFGAEAFPEKLYEKLHKLSPEAVIVNGYGPTEATISCISKVMDGSGKVTIGTPAANVRAYICDLCGNILPAGARGELVICGAGVGRGYVKLPEKTAEVFITLDGRKAYRSGDLARYNQDGEIEFFGRLDNQVKLRGLRVELDEISNVMSTYPLVTHAIVLVKGEGQQQFLCGYYVAEKPIDKGALTEHMKRSLAPYMIPSVLIQLDTMPLTANGKINKKALPEPEFSTTDREYTPPESELQKKLAEMFAKALGMERVGVKEDFFALGGTSLTASKIAMKAMLENLPIAYADIFDNPTVEKLEQFVLSKQGQTAQAPENAENAEPEVEATGMEKALSHNNIPFVDEVKAEEMGNVLLTGATGFLGIHVLKALLEDTDSTVYCLIRKGKSANVEVRLKSMLVYYFSDSMEELFGKRIQVIEGDITDAARVKELDQYDFHTVINCAACVKHFVNDDILDRINVHGVENLIAFCARTERRLVQISTVSVAGDNVNDKFPEERTIHENELFFGQELESNKYVYTKFLAEKAVLEAVAEGKLDGKIIRVGNLMSRHSDGEFQINFVTNGFMRILRGYAAIGKFPVSGMDESEEFSPIDCTAEAIVRLSGTNSEFTVFHACNSHRVQMGDVIEAMNHCGLKIEVVTDEEFAKGLTEALADEQTNMLVSGLISYLSSDSQNTVKYIDYDNRFTIKILYRLGYKWPITDGKYLGNAFMALKTLGFFDGK
ncbi:MAG: amino acid adenylation domain-containing protein [Roseburia sp.]